MTPFLDEFLKTHTGVAYCLIREKSLTSPKERLKDTLNFYFGKKYDDYFDKRIIVITGDITNAKFTLSESELQYLAQNITTIIDSAALVKHFGSYQHFYDINVNGTNNIINFAHKYNKKLYYISTLSVSGNSFDETKEIQKFDAERDEIIANASLAKEDISKKQNDIEEIRKTLNASESSNAELDGKLKECLEKKEQMSAEYKGFFTKQEEVSKHQAELDKEIFRLNNQKEKLREADEYQTNYMWEEYELTPHAAAELRNDAYDDLGALKKSIAQIKDDIRRLGDVNVNSIEEYKEVSKRYEFLKGQHDDLIEAEKTLVGIIDELDTGMRRQFTEKFAEIQREFDKSFKQLFGGGHGTLELVEDEDILECGIRIIAQPPGKKLQNMMQLSGGEKALTAIALLFAIQALKPSPFCLLDEIEAALDDSNVSRFAGYLNKLTKNTQFIVITHRRGTMAEADRLYGITMQEKGVSTLVSVNLIENDLSE